MGRKGEDSKHSLFGFLITFIQNLKMVFNKIKTEIFFFSFENMPAGLSGLIGSSELNSELFWALFALCFFTPYLLVYMFQSNL